MYMSLCDSVNNCSPSLFPPLAPCLMAAVPSSPAQWCPWWSLTQCHIPQLVPQTTSGGPFKGTWGTWSACISQTGTPATRLFRGATPTSSNTMWVEQHPSPTSDRRRSPLLKREASSTDWSCDCVICHVVSDKGLCSPACGPRKPAFGFWPQAALGNERVCLCCHCKTKEKCLLQGCDALWGLMLWIFYPSVYDSFMSFGAVLPLVQTGDLSWDCILGGRG